MKNEENLLITESNKNRLLYMRIISSISLTILSIQLFMYYPLKLNFTFSFWGFYLANINFLIQLLNSLNYRITKKEISNRLFTFIYSICPTVNFLISIIFYFVLLPLILTGNLEEIGLPSHIVKSFKHIIMGQILCHILPFILTITEIYLSNFHPRQNDLYNIFLYQLLYIIIYIINIRVFSYKIVYPLIEMKDWSSILGILIYGLVTYICHTVIVKVYNKVKSSQKYSQITDKSNNKNN